MLRLPKLPIRMQRLKRDKRGYPIPYIALVDSNGVPQFTITNEAARQHVIQHDLCGICGRKLVKQRVCVGGPLAAFHEHGGYIDPPMHKSCCQYALKVCPYLAMPRWSKEIGDRKLKDDSVIVKIDDSMADDRPELFVMVVHTDQGYILEDGYVKYVKPTRPYLDVEYWVKGEIIPATEGEVLAKQTLTEQLRKDHA